jgi:bifunctional non-homologous end joining protein LigD
MPFAARPDTREKATWVEPRLVARVRFTDWTYDRHLRAPVFLGWRNDIDPRECQFTAPAESPRRSYADELLASEQDSLTLDVEGHSLKLTHLNKVFFPEPGYTKRDLLAYYAQVADYILPFLRDRPLTLRRMPDGVTGQLFYQKEVGTKMPTWIETAEVASDGGTQRAALCNNVASLLWLTHLGCIDHNPVANRADDPEHPDYLFLDLDPTEDTPFTVVIEVARAVCAVLGQAGLKFYPKISGATGFHVFVPLERVYTWEQATTFAEIVSRLAAARVPDRVTFERKVAKRPRGRVLLDYVQTARGRALACVYSVRPTPLATVSAPVTPAELEPALKPERFTLKNLPARLGKTGDLWGDFWQSRQRLEPALERLRGATAP